MFKVDKDKCIGCGVCVAECPDGTKIKKDGKAEVIDPKKLAKCGGESVCPYGAIEETPEK